MYNHKKPIQLQQNYKERKAFYTVLECLLWENKMESLYRHSSEPTTGITKCMTKICTTFYAFAHILSL